MVDNPDISPSSAMEQSGCKILFRGGLPADESIGRCPLCFTPEISLVCPHQDFAGVNIFECLACGFWFGWPSPPQSELRDYYSTAYGQHRTWSASRSYLATMRRRAISQVLFLELHTRGIRTALDIGCGVGGLVAELNRVGVAAVGYDSDEAVVHIGRARWGANIHKGYISEADLQDQYDLVCLSHVVEHLSRPSMNLEQFMSYVRPGGYLFIEVPHCIPWMFARGVETESHLGFYSLHAMKSLAERLGLRLLKIRTAGPSIIEYYENRNLAGGCRIKGRTTTKAPIWLRLAVSRVRALTHRVLPVRTEFDQYFDTYYEPGDERGIWLRALLQVPERL